MIKTISFLFHKIETTILAIIGLFTLILLGRNSSLHKKNKTLSSNLQELSKIIDIQRKVLNVTQNTKPTNIDGITKLMCKDKL